MTSQPITPLRKEAEDKMVYQIIRDDGTNARKKERIRAKHSKLYESLWNRTREIRSTQRQRRPVSKESGRTRIKLLENFIKGTKVRNAINKLI